jgi:hypothetical protein
VALGVDQCRGDHDSLPPEIEELLLERPSIDLRRAVLGGVALTRAVAIAMETVGAASCPALPAVVSVDVLVEAVRAALHGCVGPRTPTPTPTETPQFTPTPPPSSDDTRTPTHTVPVSESGVDLIPLRVSLARCRSVPCLTVPFDSGSVCVANQGSVDAGEFLVDVNGEAQVLLEGLPSGSARCFDVRIVGSATVIVDVDDRIAEAREDNNERSFPAPGPTSCDVIVPTCTPIPG